MKRKRIGFTDNTQTQLDELFAALTVASEQCEEQYCPIWQFGIQHCLLFEELQQELEQYPDIPDATRSEILTVYRYPDLACDAAVGKLAVRSAVKQARARRQGKPVTSTEEERVLRAAKTALKHFGSEKAWKYDAGLFYLEFIPHPKPSASASESQ